MAMIFNDWARRPLAGRRAFGLRFGDRRDRRSLPERGRGPGRWSNLAPISRAIWADHGDVHPPQSGFQKKKDETKRNSVVVFLSACLSALVTFLLVRAVFFHINIVSFVELVCTYLMISVWLSFTLTQFDLFFLRFSNCSLSFLHYFTYFYIEEGIFVVFFIVFAIESSRIDWNP